MKRGKYREESVDRREKPEADDPAAGALPGANIWLEKPVIDRFFQVDVFQGRHHSSPELRSSVV